MDERLLSLIQGGADVTVKLRKQNTFILIRLGDESYKASAGSFEKALERVLDSVNRDSKSHKHKRREKEKLRQDIMEQLEDDYQLNF